jgi:hypothetical protein
MVATMHELAVDAPLDVRVEVNNLQETLDLLQHKLRNSSPRLEGDDND